MTARPTIVFQMINQYADLLSDLAAELRDEHNIDSILVYRGRFGLPDPAVYQFASENFVDLIDVESSLTPRPATDIPATQALARTAGELERRLRVRVVEALRADRHIGHGFVTGADYPRSSYAIDLSYDQCLDIVCRLAERVESILRQPNVISVAAAPSSVLGNLLLATGDGLGLHVRVPNLSPRGNFQWQNDRFYTPVDFARRYETELARTPLEIAEVGAQPQDSSLRLANYVKNFTRLTSISFLLKRLYQVTRRKCGDHVKRRGRVYGGYLYRDEVMHLIKVWLLRRKAVRTRAVLPQIADGVPFVLFPLTMEPESTLMAESPMCDNQLGYLDWLAKAVPAGWRVVVKEHPGFTAPRAKGFWERVASYPNVIVASPLESGEDLMERATCVGVIRSTLGMQAAIAGKPVVSPHPYYVGAVLPHVFITESFGALSDALKRIADEDLPSLADRCRAAKALWRVLEDGVTLSDQNLIRGVAGGEPIPPRETREIAEILVSSFSPPICTAERKTS